MRTPMEDSEVINFSALEKELQAALEADKKYRRENDAKFRAIHQNVGSYEEFRDIVLASHLKPLEKKDKADGPRKQPWNPVASGSGKPGTTHCVTVEASEFQSGTAAEFSRDWRRLAGSMEDRYRLLLSLGGEAVGRIFSAELGAGLLGDFLLVLWEGLRPADAVAVVTVLEGMSRTGRFGLGVAFLSCEERAACRGLMGRLLEILGDGAPAGDTGQHTGTAARENVLEKLRSLMQLYGVHIDPKQEIFLRFPELLSAYEAPEDKEDVFAKRACPAFLVFQSAAYLEDMTIELPCHCKPEQAHSVVWYYQKQLGGEQVRVLTDFEGTALVDPSRVGRGTDLRQRFSIRLFSLLVFRVRESDSGHYLCGTSSGQFFYGYEIDVQRVRRVSFPPRRGPGGPARTPPPRGGASGPYRAFTSFWPWSPCDRCGVGGEQTRVGLCYLRGEHLSVRYLRGPAPRASAPCGSAAVPPRFRLRQGRKGAELSVRSCHAPCPPEPAERRGLLDLLGLLGSGGAGPRVPVFYHSHPAGSPLLLSCPGALPQHAVAWDRSGLPLYRSRHMEGLNRTARLFIDAGHHLHLRPARLEDQGSYTCWLQGRRAAEIRLGVYLRLGRSRRASDPESQHALRALGLCYAAYSLLFLLLTLVRLSWSCLKRKQP